MTQLTVSSYQYDAANRLTQVTRPNDISTAYTYDDASRLLSITHADGVELLSSFAYSYDNVGNRIQAVEDVKLPQLPPVPTSTPTITPTATQADTPTPSMTFTPTETPTATLIPSETPTPTQTLEFTLIPSETPEFTFTPSETPTPTIASTPTETSTPTATLTPSETATPFDTFTPTLTPTPFFTFTPSPTATSIPSGPVTINYTYDPLYRLTEANYSTGDYYHYTYDAVGNRLSETTQLAVTSYQYDYANRLTSVDSVTYTWDNNGNLLNDGVNSYSYNTANQLTAMSGPFGSSTFSYNGLGDRLTQNGVNYTLDLNMGLTQVLSDGTNTYLYGLGRIAEYQGSVSEYYLGDALESVLKVMLRRF